MEIVNKKISTLKAADYNPRRISKDDFEQLKKSVESFEMVEPIIVNVHPDRMNVIVGGHQRIKAMKALKMKEAPCVEVNLPLEREKELNIRLNRNTGEFDFDMLASYFDEQDLLAYGFKDEELGFFQSEEESAENNEKKDGKKSEHLTECPACGAKFSLTMKSPD